MTDVAAPLPPDPAHKLNLQQVSVAYAGGSATVLRACPACRACHPLALKIPPADTSVCWSCGAPIQSAQFETFDLNARITFGPLTRIFVGLCERAANWLNSLADRIAP